MSIRYILTDKEIQNFYLCFNNGKKMRSVPMKSISFLEGNPEENKISIYYSPERKVYAFILLHNRFCFLKTFEFMKKHFEKFKDSKI